jgi:hypothetical protein
MATFNPMETPIDVVLIGDPPVTSPKITRVKGAALERKWDKIMGPGWSGGFLRYMGQPLNDFSIECDLADDEDWEQWELFRTQLIAPPIGAKAAGTKKQGIFNALPIQHPWLSQHNVTSMVLGKLHAPEKQEQGHFTVRAECFAFRMPKLTLAKIEGSAPPKPLTEREQRIADNSGLIKARTQATPKT